MGPVADTIARVAHPVRCNGIVIGTHGRTVISRLALGSDASEVLHLVDIPLTLVK